MIRTPVAGLRGHVGETVTIAGWAQALRLQRAMQAPLPIDSHTGPEGRLDWRFLDVRRRPGYGCPPHGAFGLGLGRLLMAMLGLESIRDATFLFRGPNRLTP